MALREQFTTALKESMKAGQQRRVSTVRMILAALKERDIDARGKGNPNGIEDGDIQRMLQGLIKQRREAIELYKQGNRPELAQQEQEEIAVIETFLPKQMSEAEAETAIKQVIAAVGASSVKDMGKVMAALKEKYSGQLDLSKAGGIVKKLLG
ncbi:MAG TPA: GatB/YqeY domain-containing protein [Stellaceae bacterium]|nr:GatB/YqeY domain-containing protein [Stellaceae bacterium]